MRALETRARGRQVQAASRRVSHAAFRWRNVHRGRWSRPSNTARGTPGDRQSVVTMLVWILSQYHTRLRASRKPGVPRAPWHIGPARYASERRATGLGLRARPRRPKNRAGGALFLLRHCEDCAAKPKQNEAIHRGRIVGTMNRRAYRLLRCARNDGFHQSRIVARYVVQAAISPLISAGWPS